VRHTPDDRRKFSGGLDAKKLQDQIDALRERQAERIFDSSEEGIVARIKAALAGEEKPKYPYALAGLRGKKRTKRTKKWTPTFRYVSADSLTHRAKDTRFNR
jgi:hypothetical protein